MHWQLFIEILGFVLLGAFAGLFSGLMGAGGGLVTVPGLAFLLRLQGVNPKIIMHVAIGTTLAKMMVVASRSLYAHTRRKLPFFPIYKQMVPGVVLGAIVGGITAHFLHSYVLKILFGIFVLTMAIHLLLTHKKQSVKPLPGRFPLLFAGSFVGLQSGFFGIGGSVFTVPYLTHHSVSIRIAVIVSVAFAATVATVGTCVFMITGLFAVDTLSWTTGYIYWPAWLGLVVGGVSMAPVGAKLSHYLPPEMLKRYFAIFLILVGVHMIWPV